MSEENFPSDILSGRVRRTLDDLAEIRESLLAISEETHSEDHSKLLDLELAGELKNVVDALRLLLWAYVKALSSKSGRALLKCSTGRRWSWRSRCCVAFARVLPRRRDASQNLSSSSLKLWPPSHLKRGSSNSKVRSFW